MEDVEGYSWSHWTLPSGNYSLHIAPADARVTVETMTMRKYTLFAGHFDGHGNLLVQYHMYHLIQGGSGLRQKPLDATIGQVLRLIVAMGQKTLGFSQVFSSSLVTRYKRDQGDVKDPNNNKVMTYRYKGEKLGNTMQYLVGGVNILE